MPIYFKDNTTNVTIGDKQYPKNSLIIEKNANGNIDIKDLSFDLLYSIPWTEWVNSLHVPYASIDLLVTDLQNCFA